MEIPIEIGLSEPLARIILHSFHYSESKKVIRPEAFIPSPSEVDEISVLRFAYTDADFCKGRGMFIANRRDKPNQRCKFIGICVLYSHEVIHESSLVENISCHPIASPYDENDILRTDRPVYKTDKGLPMHADLKYSMVIEQDKPMSQQIKQLMAKPLCKKANSRFFKDEDVNCPNWVGDEIAV